MPHTAGNGFANRRSGDAPAKCTKWLVTGFATIRRRGRVVQLALWASRSFPRVRDAARAFSARGDSEAAKALPRVLFERRRRAESELPAHRPVNPEEKAAGGGARGALEPRGAQVRAARARRRVEARHRRRGRTTLRAMRAECSGSAPGSCQHSQNRHRGPDDNQPARRDLQLELRSAGAGPRGARACASGRRTGTPRARDTVVAEFEQRRHPSSATEKERLF